MNRHLDGVDLLRGLAVTLVILFHYFPTMVPGGFIGVDVFFVISGYVLGRAYLQEKTSIGEFAIARIRRLVPALLFMLVVISLIAGFVLYPDDLLQFSHALISQSLYLQNFHFWAEGDYFRNAVQKPLLHTWTLGVEAQFYVGFALWMLLFQQHAPTAITIMLGLAVGSLALGMMLEVRSPKTVFFLMPTRLWEFAVGLSALLLARHFPGFRIPFARALLMVIPAGIVALAVMSPIHDTLFPAGLIMGAAGTALMLFLIETIDRPVRFFNWRSLLFPGQISYGLYLWHWPPLSLFYLFQQRLPDAWETAALLGAVFAMAVISFYLVEQPMRRAGRFRRFRPVFTMALSAALLTAAVSLMIRGTDGGLFRYPVEIRTYIQAGQHDLGARCSRIFILFNPGAEICPVNKVDGAKDRVLVIGDSQALMLRSMLSDLGRQMGVSVYFSTRNCDLGEFGETGFCSEQVMATLIRQARDQGIHHVLLSSLWRNNEVVRRPLRQQARKFQDAGFQLGFFQSIPIDGSYDPGRRARLAVKANVPPDDRGIGLKTYRQQTQAFRRKINEIKAGFATMPILNPATLLCPGARCLYVIDGEPLYRDTMHLSDRGADFLRPLFRPYLARLVPMKGVEQ